MKDRIHDLEERLEKLERLHRGQEQAHAPASERARRYEMAHEVDVNKQLEESIERLRELANTYLYAGGKVIRRDALREVQDQPAGGYAPAADPKQDCDA